MSQVCSVLTAGICLLSSMMATGCVPGEDDTSVVILFNAIPTNEGGGVCTVPTNEGSQYLARGLIDADWPLGYQFFPLVKNYTVTANSDSPEGRAFIDGADIQLQVAGDAVPAETIADYTEFSTRFSASVAPNGGVASMGFQIVPIEVLTAIGNNIGAGETATVRATIQLFGLLSGSNFRTQEFTFWIDVCSDCGVSDSGQACGVPTAL